MLEKVKSRLHVRGKCCASVFFTETVHTLRRNRIAITTF